MQQAVSCCVCQCEYQQTDTLGRVRGRAGLQHHNVGAAAAPAAALGGAAAAAAAAAARWWLVQLTWHYLPSKAAGLAAAAGCNVKVVVYLTPWVGSFDRAAAKLRQAAAPISLVLLLLLLPWEALLLLLLPLGRGWSLTRYYLCQIWVVRLLWLGAV